MTDQLKGKAYCSWVTIDIAKDFSSTTSLAISRRRDGRVTFLRGTRWRFRP